MSFGRGNRLGSAVLLLLLGLAPPVAAGPCGSCGPPGWPLVGWWNERPLSAADRQTESPAIDVDDHNGEPHIVAVWADVTGADGDLWIGTSDDQGCSFSVRPLTTGPGDDRQPEVLVAAALDQVLVVFVRDGRVHFSHSSDRGASFTAPVELVHPALPSGAVRLAGVPIAGQLAAHVVWSAGGSLVLARRDTSQPGWVWAIGDLGAGLIGFDTFADPDVAVDTRSSDPATVAGVSVVVAAQASGRRVREVIALRSLDGGASFYGDPIDPGTLNRPRRVSDPRADAPAFDAVLPRLDDSDDGNGAFYVWQAVTWREPVGSGQGAWCDARAEEGTGPTLVADWNEPPGAADVEFGAGATPAAGLAVIPNPFGRPPTPEIHLLVEDDSGGPLELGAVRGHLDAAAVPTVTLQCSPYAVTGLAPVRVDGEVVAGSVAVDEDLSHVHAVWVDSRGSANRVWYKRTDSFTVPPTAVEAVPIPCAQGGGLRVSWTPASAPPHCDVDHHVVEYGLSPTALDRSVMVFGASTVDLTGLDPGVVYFIRVSTVDQACNRWSALDVAATTAACGAPRCPNPVGNTVLMVAVGADARLVWVAPPVDAAHGPATSYDLYRATVRGRDGYGLIVNSAMAAADLTGVVPVAAGRQHYYKVVARNSCGTSGDEPPP